MKTELQWHAGPLSDWPICKIENNIQWVMERVDKSPQSKAIMDRLEEYRAERANRVINNRNKN